MPPRRAAHLHREQPVHRQVLRVERRPRRPRGPGQGGRGRRAPRHSPSCAGRWTSCSSTPKKEDYLDYLKAVEPRLVKGALIIADNTGIYRRDVKPYLAHVRDRRAVLRAASTTSASTAWKSRSSRASRVRRAPRPRVPQASLRADGDPAQAHHRHHRRLSRAPLHPRGARRKSSRIAPSRSAARSRSLRASSSLPGGPGRPTAISSRSTR